jgi:signal transduction histidine kinase
VTIRDEGIGISPDDMKKVFTPFFRADKSRTRATGGLGLGLSLVKAVVEAHGGRVAVESAPGKGSTFTVWLPRKGA